MSISDVRARLSKSDPFIADAAIAVGLTLLVCLQVWAVTHVRPPEFRMMMGGGGFIARREFSVGPLPYFFIACTFLPLAWRRTVPWFALVGSGLFAAAYQLLPAPPTFTVLAPMISLYSLAAYGKRRHVALIALLVVGMVVAVPAFAFSFGVRWVAQSVGTFALLATAALLGDTARNRREYILEVERRAADAERSREEEARRRVDEERMHIAREVHDIVAHSLSIVTVQAAAAEAVLDKNPEQARESIRNIRVTGREALGELRSMLDVLRTGEGEAPLAPAADLTHLEQLVAPVRDAGIEVDLKVEGDVAAVPAYASVSAYRIVQEALTNAVRHANARQIGVLITINGGELALAITDDGTGPTGADGGGHGIQGMRERVDALGGSFEAGPSEPGGFRVAAAIPLTRSV